MLNIGIQNPKKNKDLLAIFTVFIPYFQNFIKKQALLKLDILSKCKSCIAKIWSKGPSTKDVRKFFPIFDPYPPHVCNCLHFKDPSLKRTSANQKFDPPPLHFHVHNMVLFRFNFEWSLTLYCAQWLKLLWKFGWKNWEILVQKPAVLRGKTWQNLVLWRSTLFCALIYVKW